ncbi:MAG: FHA domain-containing protein [Planctomycetota bacterium]
MAKITVMLGDKRIGVFPMETTPFVCGREAKGGVLIENAGVSRKHCQFTYEDGRYYVEDLGSSNGTHFQGMKVTKAEVRNGDQINVGKYVLMFEDVGLEMIPRGVGEPAVGPGGAGPKRAPGLAGLDNNMKTFQVDPETLRAQMAKAGVAAAAAGNEARRAADVMAAYDPDALVDIKKRRKGVGRFIFPALKLLGIAIGVTLVVLAIMFVKNLVDTGGG